MNLFFYEKSFRETFSTYVFYLVFSIEILVDTFLLQFYVSNQVEKLKIYL